MNQQERITSMANIMVQARRDNEDVGALIAAALHMAADRPEGADILVRGRPGSWEADIVLHMARTGGSGNVERIKELSSLFVAMGEAGEDGGDVLSQAMGKAVDELGGLDKFAISSRWHHDLIGMGRQYSNHWDD